MENTHKRMMLRASMAISALFLVNSALFAQDMASPPNSLVVDDTGKVGIGTATPVAKLNVSGNSAISEDVQVLVHNTDTSNPGVAKTLFVIKNDNGPAKFSMFPNTTGDVWAFNALANEFRISKQGTGVREMTITDSGQVIVSGTVVHGSSRTIKHDIVNVDTQEILNKVLDLPITKWTYNRDVGGIQHLGPMAEDFYQAFGLGNTDKGIAFNDTSGVALAAIKGLHEIVKEKDARIAEMSDRLARLESLVSSLVAKDKVVMNR